MNKKELFAVTLAGFIVSNVLSKIIERRREEKYFSDSLKSTIEQYRRWRELRDS